MNAIRTLISHAIDYAGLFPPARLGMADAVRNYAIYRSGQDAWALGAFVLPLGRLREFEAAAEGLRVDRQIPLSVILPSFDSDVRPLTEGLSFGSVISTEVRVEDSEQALAVVSAVPPGITNYFELQAGGSHEDVLETISDEGERAKLRTGGIEPGSIPPPIDVVNFLFECRETKVGFKATAGLHHAIRGAYPLTYEQGAPVEYMHGFLNVLLAAALVFIAGERDSVQNTIEEEKANTFRFYQDSVEWYGLTMTVEQLRYAREQFAISFGSCSFEEPLSDLHSLGLI